MMDRRFLGMEGVLEDGRYRLIRQIGGGSGGVVWSARDTVTKQKVAIKRIANLNRDLDTLRRTLREIKLLRHFNHENIISVIDVLKPTSKDFREVFVTYELMGTDLHRVIRSPTPLPDDTIQLFIYQILRGLKCVHSAGVLHRDLKPTNLLVNANYDLKICDFGCGRSSAPGKGSGRSGLKMTLLEHVATRWYRAPEGLLSLDNYTTAVDVWSVGCILAELFGRKVLFAGKSNEEQLSLILEVLGTPTEEQIANLPFLHGTDSKLAEQLRSMPPRAATPWQQIFPNASEQGLDLLSKMLEFDPARRITVEDALRHPYLATLHDDTDEPVADELFEESWEKDVQDLEGFQDLLYAQIEDMHKTSTENQAVL
ncbi:Mitogen-activated protein kinase [Balamuthia mandrillaris]